MVWSSLLLTEVVLGYLEISFSFAPVTTDVIVKAVELMKLFDTRTKQLVLGAQVPACLIAPLPYLSPRPPHIP